MSETKAARNLTLGLASSNHDTVPILALETQFRHNRVRFQLSAVKRRIREGFELASWFWEPDH